MKNKYGKITVLNEDDETLKKRLKAYKNQDDIT